MASLIPHFGAHANAVEKYEVSTAIHASVDKFYGFFKYSMNELVTIFPVCFKAAELLEGEEGVVGNIKLWKYNLGGITLTAKVKTEVIDDEGKTITFAVLEGNLLLLYKSFKVSLTVTNGLVKWTFFFEKLSILTPIPQLYGPIVITASTLVDAYLLVTKSIDKANAIDTFEVLEGTEGTIGCVKEWNYILGGLPLTAKEKTDAIDDEVKSITFTVLEGDLMLFYKSFKVTLTVTDGSVKWTITFEKRSLLSPIPELYGPILITASTLVDAFLLITA